LNTGQNQRVRIIFPHQSGSRSST